MIIKDAPYLNAVGRSYRSFPILALERFLRIKGWKRTVLPPEIKTTIKSAIGFFDLALEGDIIVDDASREKIFSGNLSAIRAYNIATTAYELLDSQELSFKDVLFISKKVLATILDKDTASSKSPNERDVDLLYEYIVELAKVMYSDK